MISTILYKTPKYSQQLRTAKGSSFDPLDHILIEHNGISHEKVVRKAPSLRNNNGAIQVRVRIDGKDHFISRLGRWDNPVAVAKAQALSARIWSDFQSGTFDRSLRIYQPLSQGQDAALLERLKINAETLRQKRAIHAYRVVKRYGKPLRSLTDTQEFIRWAQEN